MSNDSDNLRHRQRQESGTGAGKQQTGSTPVEFATTDELLRHDAGQTEPPAAILERLSRSLAAEPIPKKPWWQRLFSK
jgi:hypothetical protein